MMVIMFPTKPTLEERVLEAFHNDPVLAERAIDIGAIGTGVIELTGWVQVQHGKLATQLRLPAVCLT